MRAFNRSRWTSKGVESVISALRTGRASRPFGLTDENRVDLRGIPIPEGTKLDEVHLCDYDLSGARLRSAWIENCVFENARFDGADLSGLADHGNRFSDCVFNKTKFIAAALGYKGTEYEGCRFSSANFSRAAFIRPEFNACRFVSCELKGADFNASSFADCTFEGLLRHVWFRGGYGFPGDVDTFGRPRPNRMANVSFANAELRDVHFSNHCDLSSVVLPLAGNYRRYSSWRSRLEHLRELSKGWPSSDRSEAEIFVRSHMVHAQGQDSYLVNCDDVKRGFGVDLGERIIDGLGQPG